MENINGKAFRIVAVPAVRARSGFHDRLYGVSFFFSSQTRTRFVS